jgi:transposase InsO family protein
MARGFVYLVAVIDWYSRKVLSWRLSNTLDASFCVDALEEAIDTYGKPDIQIKAASSPVRTLQMCSKPIASGSVWVLKAARSIVCSLSASGASRSMRRFTSKPMMICDQRSARSTSTSDFTTANDGIRARMIRHRTVCIVNLSQSWRHNPGEQLSSCTNLGSLTVTYLGFVRTG